MLNIKNNPILSFIEQLEICTIDEAPEYFSKGWVAILAEYREGETKKLVMAKLRQLN